MNMNTIFGGGGHLLSQLKHLGVNSARAAIALASQHQIEVWVSRVARVSEPQTDVAPYMGSFRADRALSTYIVLLLAFMIR